MLLFLNTADKIKTHCHVLPAFNERAGLSALVPCSINPHPRERQQWQRFRFFPVQSRAILVWSLGAKSNIIQKTSSNFNYMDVVKEIKEIKTQLAYSKNFGFFFGAGTSCALKIPDIAALTIGVEAKL